jgi:RNA polymerase sigma-70 factor (ECF subfamily)
MLSNQGDCIKKFCLVLLYWHFPPGITLYLLMFTYNSSVIQVTAGKSNMILQKEIEEAYDSYSKEIFTYIIRSVHNHDEAEDILQDVFVKLIKYSAKSSVHSGNIRALLYSIARSVCVDAARKSAKNRVDSLDLNMLPDNSHETADDSPSDLFDTVNSSIKALGEPEKSIILLRKNGLTYKEISLVTKISERTLKRKVKSVITDIRKKLKDEGFFIPADTVERE